MSQWGGLCTQALAKLAGWSATGHSLALLASREDERWEDEWHGCSIRHPAIRTWKFQWEDEWHGQSIHHPATCTWKFECEDEWHSRYLKVSTQSSATRGWVTRLVCSSSSDSYLKVSTPPSAMRGWVTWSVCSSSSNLYLKVSTPPSKFHFALFVWLTLASSLICLCMLACALYGFIFIALVVCPCWTFLLFFCGV